MLLTGLELMNQKIPMKQPITYRDAGVDIDAGNSLVERIKLHAQKTARPGAMPSLGGFGGFFDLAQIGYKDPLLVSATDGVGTKLKIAQAVNKHETIGIDLVAMCVNDLLVHGAQPLFFLDYFATGKLSVDDTEHVIAGIAHGCKQAGCALIGGETAEMPGMYKADEYDLAGFTVGAVERDQVLPKKNEIKPGDVIIGLASSGVHSNGFSLIRRLLDAYTISLHDKPPFESDHEFLYQALLEPTKIYVKTVLPLLKNNHVKALAHITGGGLLENIPRVLPNDLGVELKKDSWPIRPIFKWIQELAHLDKQEMFRTFNMGIGMVIVVSNDQAKQLQAHVQENGEHAWIIGQVISSSTKNKRIILS